MGKLQAIENALASINGAVFQELCDCFLVLRNKNYAAFSRSGSQAGKQKTTKGTPDSFFLLPDGKYLFVEYSTNVSAGISKLKDDIQKCIDSSKTGIPVTEIAEIILCVNFKIKPNEINDLKKLLHRGIKLTIYDIHGLSIELSLNHQNLVHQYLGLSFDTGQIVSIPQFIKEYGKRQGISTPLDNPFFHRDLELKQLKESIQKSDLVILTGAPGTGKTKLAIETINDFVAGNQTYTSYCIANKHYPLLEDLYQYFDKDGDYILFIDDANRIDTLGQIVGFYASERSGNLKIVITVRDYAFPEVQRMFYDFSPERIDVLRLSDEQIKDIIKSKPFEILNSDFQDAIVEIADGNPRLAIMSALLARKTNSLRSLSNVSELFENYFLTFVSDDNAFANEMNTKCLGLIAFFHTLPYKDENLMTPILSNFGIEYSGFIDAIDELDKLELVEIQFDNVKVPEQNLATFFFYQAFVKGSHLSFETLLNRCFEQNNIHRFRDCVIPANNLFGGEQIMDKLKPDLQKHLKNIIEDEERAVIFLSTFWFYLWDETLEFIYNKVSALPLVEVGEYEVSYEVNEFSYDKNKIIALLGNFFEYSHRLKDALELGLELARKSPEVLPELIHKIRQRLLFQYEDQKFDFSRQHALFNILIKGLKDEDELLTAVFYELSKTFLEFNFEEFRGGRGNTVTFRRYPIPCSEPIKEFRAKVWDEVNNNFESHPDKSINFLEAYPKFSFHSHKKEVIEYDVSYVVKIIERHLNPESFGHCYYVQNLLWIYKGESISHQTFDDLSESFTNLAYKTYLKLDWNKRRDKESYEFDNYKEYQSLKEAELREAFLFRSHNEIQSFYNILLEIKEALSWEMQSRVIDIIIDENLNKDVNLGCKIIETIAANNNELRYSPNLLFQNQLQKTEAVQKIWDTIQKCPFRFKFNWELQYFSCLDKSLIQDWHPSRIIDTFKNIDEPTTIFFYGLQKYLQIAPELFVDILKIITDINNHGVCKVSVQWDFFGDYFQYLGDNNEVIETAYIQQKRIQPHIDTDGKAFVEILKKTPEFLVKFFKDEDAGKEQKYGFIWYVDGIESQLELVFDAIIEEEFFFGISEHFCNVFFENVPVETKDRVEKFLMQYAKSNHDNTKKMTAIVDISKHTMKHLYEKILLQHIHLNQDVDIFSSIRWRGSQGVRSGNVIFGDIEASDWQNILSIVSKSDLGMELIPIKKLLNQRIEYGLEKADDERRSRFLYRR